MIIWSLFDSETACVASTFAEHEVYSFGKGNGTKHVHLDLSDFAEAKKVLDTYPKPDAIFASPPCETWVIMNVGHIGRFGESGGHNLYWKDFGVPYDLINPDMAYLRPKRVMGEKTAETTARLIQHYKPNYYAVENGNTSLIFRYLKECGLEGYKNKCTYYSYGAEVLKPTIIYSNMKLNLLCKRPRHLMLTVITAGCKGKALKCRELNIKVIHKGFYHNDKIRQKKEYAEASKVPPDLYRHIMSEWLLGGQPTLFPLS
jgi:hypothetical protein